MVARLLDQLADEITGARKDLAILGDRLERLCAVHRHLSEEFRVDTKVLRDFDNGT
ncbi:MAG TPA: hypothetical protein VE666_11155 [Mycobacterium sp.]|nr:hypothetical protein [Mycobacterium sp.]